LGKDIIMNLKYLAVLLILVAWTIRAEEECCVVDIVYPISGITLSLELDENGYAKRDYDGFLSFPSSYDLETSLIATEWEKRGLGIFAEISATNSGTDYSLSATLEEASLSDWNTTNLYGYVIRSPVFSSHNIKTTVVVFPDQWIDFPRVINSNDIVGMRVRLRKTFPNHGLESTGAPPAAEAPETHP